MPDLKLDNADDDAQLEAEPIPTNNRFGGGLFCINALNIRRLNNGVKYFGGRTNEIRDQFSLSVKNAARADGNGITQLQPYSNFCNSRKILLGPTILSVFAICNSDFTVFDMAESSLQVCTRFPRHFFQTKKFRGSDEIVSQNRTACVTTPKLSTDCSL